ncbi:DUF3055 domain-containing protein [Bacillus sp. FJAT-47783]|uniref:DUF3055 domain-containing protein n=1 Tax=Bacillus sp. FJAT-47783 TaxID=2922712 RepID=UPI001FAE6538|nr:DUF3055 domain-containing protein [Bacillus sp. FJAT-47783]
MKVDILLDETESQTAKYVCFAAEMKRYDFTVFILLLTGSKTPPQDSVVKQRR